MRKFPKFNMGRSILHKMILTAAFAAAVVLFAGFLSVSATFNTYDTFEEISTEEFGAVILVGKTVVSFKKQVQEWKNVLIRGSDDKKREKYWKKFKQQHDEVQQNLSDLLPMVHEQATKKRIDEIKAVHASLASKYEAGFNAFVASDYSVKAGDKAVAGIDRAPTKMLEELENDIHEELTLTLKDTFAEAYSGLLVTGLIMLAGILLAFLSFLFISNRAIIAPSKALSRDVARIAEGDFTVDVKIHSNDEIGELAESVRKLKTSLGNMVNEITSVVNQLGISADTLSTIAQETKSGIRKQNDETDQVATAINEMTSTVQEVSNHATQAASAAGEANNQADIGKNEVTKAVSAINDLAGEVEHSSRVIRELEQHSQEISSVLDVIRGIAEQTNLLALNAAIEAARAGEQGRGFAVVADEVRMLAQRTQESTQEIQGMIERLLNGANNAVSVMDNSQGRAVETVTQAETAGETLNAIVAAIGLINDMNTQIASAAEEQAAVADEINRNITSITEISNSSSRNIEETSKESDNVAKMSQTLQQLVSQFKV